MVFQQDAFSSFWIHPSLSIFKRQIKSLIFYRFNRVSSVFLNRLLLFNACFIKYIYIYDDKQITKYYKRYDEIQIQSPTFIKIPESLVLVLTKKNNIYYIKSICFQKKTYQI